MLQDSKVRSNVEHLFIHYSYLQAVAILKELLAKLRTYVINYIVATT